jgi:hypothetical protein
MFLGLQSLSAFWVGVKIDTVFREWNVTANLLTAGFEERSQDCEKKGN